jgi:glutathione S-transferase
MAQTDVQPTKKKTAPAKTATGAEATITISSKNYSSWCLRGWLLCKFAGLEVAEKMIPADDASARAELLLLSPSFLVPCLSHNGVTVWDTLAIAEYLNEIKPKAGLLPADRAARALCRAISGEMHSGFMSMRAALPMNLKGHFPGFRIWANAQADIDRILHIWHDCFKAYKGPYLFGAQRTLADAMYAPVVTRFLSYDVKLDGEARAFAKHIMAMPEMIEWVAAAKTEPEELEELDVEF